MKRTLKHFILPLIITSTLTLTSCYQLFQSKIPMAHTKPGLSLTDVMEEEVKIEKLGTPDQIFVSQGLYKDTIRISWSAVEGAASYNLERAIVPASETNINLDNLEFNSIKASGNGIITSTFIPGTEYTDVITTNPSYLSDEYNNVYIYRVSAENKRMGYESGDFKVSEKASLFAPPKNVSATAGESSDRVDITWEKAAKAIRYKVYRSGDASNSNPILIKEVSGDVTKCSNSIGTSEQGIDYYYTVEAINSNSNVSVKSAVSMGYALKEGAPSRIRNVKISEHKGRGDGDAKAGIEVTWTSESGLLYTVYRSSSKDSSLTQIATAVSDNKITDKKSLKANTYYYYYVLGYKTMGAGDSAEIVKGPLSKSGPDDEVPAEGFILSPPENISVDRIGNRFQINFSQPIGEKGYLSDSGLYEENYNTYSYEILGGNSMDDVSNPVAFEEVYPVNGYYNVLVDNTYKFFKIISVNNTAKSSSSEIVAPSPSAATNVKATKAEFIEGVMTVNPDSQNHTVLCTGANANEVFPVKITWSAPSDGADGGYHIYRSTDPEKGYRKITDEPVTTLSYIDANDSSKAGTYYYYKVLSLNQLGKGSNYSDFDAGYGALTYNQYMREYNKTIQSSQKRLILMHKSPDTAKLGSETQSGINGTVYYNAAMAGLGARIIMLYTDYVDYEVSYNNKGTEKTIPYFKLNGNTNTSASMDSSGTMDGTVTNGEEGMYPGTVVYDNIKIVGGNAGGGYYIITPKGFPAGDVDYTVGNEGW